MTTRLDTTPLHHPSRPSRHLRIAMRRVPAFVLLVLAVYALATDLFSPAALVVIALAGLVAAMVTEANRPWHPRPALATPGPGEPWSSSASPTRPHEEGGSGDAA